VADEPYFPRHEPGSVYRAPAPRALAKDDAPRKVVSRPVVVERPAEERAAAPSEPLPSLRAVMSEDRGYWARNTFATRHPRLVGGLMTAIGGLLTASAMSTYLHGGYYTTRTVVIGPFALAVGLFLLAFGIPLDEENRITSGWKGGITAASLAGLAAGIALLTLLARAS
jgi:hypothetical protein